MDDGDAPLKDCQEKIRQLLEILKKLQEENERLREKVRTFYGH